MYIGQYKGRISREVVSGLIERAIEKYGTQEEVAKVYGVDQTHISGLLRQKRNIGIHILFYICHVEGTSLDALVLESERLDLEYRTYPLS